MTKEQFLNKWHFTGHNLISKDLEAVIAHEIAKVKEVKAEPEELKGNCLTFDMSRLVDQEYKPTDQVTDQVTDHEQPAINPIAEAYERGEKIRMKNWLKKDWIQKHNETKTIDNNCFINSVFSFGFIQHPQLWELYTEPTEQPSSQVILDNSFDKERFEAMFRAVVASKEFMTIVEEIEQAEIYLTKLDAYYASKEGGNNG